MTTSYKTDLAPENLDTAEGGAKAVLERAQKSLGFVPNMYGGMAVVPAVLDTYLDGYKRFREETGFTRPSKRWSSSPSPPPTAATTAPPRIQ